MFKSTDEEEGRKRAASSPYGTTFVTQKPFQQTLLLREICKTNTNLDEGSKKGEF
jgi:hypothetical protein